MNEIDWLKAELARTTEERDEAQRMLMDHFNQEQKHHEEFMGTVLVLLGMLGKVEKP